MQILIYTVCVFVILYICLHALLVLVQFFLYSMPVSVQFLTLMKDGHRVEKAFIIIQKFKLLSDSVRLINRQRGSSKSWQSLTYPSVYTLMLVNVPLIELSAVSCNPSAVLLAL